MLRLLRSLFVVSCTTLIVSTAPACLAQATRTASKGADISVFGAYQIAHPDYGPDNTHGGAVGAAYTAYLHLPVEPSLEFRANFNSNYAVIEHSYVVGLRAAVPLGILKPYADFLVGPGTIQFPLNRGYPSDNSTVYSYGGGLDVHITGNFSARFDLQAQHWNTGELTYTPTLGTLGVVYRIPFHPHVSQRDLGR